MRGHMPSDTTMPAHAGACLCGAVQWTASERPTLQFNCYCIDCRKSTGAAFVPIMFFRAESVKIIGALSRFSSPGGSGHPMHRDFCSRCGAQVAAEIALMPGLISIRAGTLADIEAFTPPRHCSFIASTNNRQCLQDIGGNRRFLPITITGIDYHTPVNHPGLYAQAIALLKDGFRYWYEGEEIEQLNKHNERHRMKDPVEENLFVFFRKPLPEDLQVKWLPASVILTKLSIFGKVQVNPHTQLVLVQALEKYGFGTRTNEQETTEYEVVDIQLYQ